MSGTLAGPLTGAVSGPSLKVTLHQAVGFAVVEEADWASLRFAIPLWPHSRSSAGVGQASLPSPGALPARYLQELQDGALQRGMACSALDLSVGTWPQGTSSLPQFSFRETTIVRQGQGKAPRPSFLSLRGVGARKM